MAVFCGIDWAEGHHDIALVDENGSAGRQAADRREPGRGRGVHRDAGRGRRQRGGADPGRDRDTARAAGRGAARHRPADLPDQPAGGGPLSGTHLGVGQEERPRRRDGVGEHPAHRSHLHRMLPDDSRAGPRRSPCSHAPIRTRCGGAPSWCRSCGPGCASTTRGSWPRSLPVRAPGGAVDDPAGQQRRPRGAGDRTQPDRRPEGVQGPGRDSAAPRRTAASHRQPRRERRRRAACPAATPGSPGRAGDARPRRSPCSACSTRSATSVDQLAAALAETFSQHPDYEIITSFPGLADISGAIVLAEIGDDRTRFADDRALQAFAGSAPVTRASGKSRTVTRRRTKNNRLAGIGYSWAFTAAAPTLTNAGALPAPPRTRRRAPGRAAAPVQPDARPTAPLPAHRPDLRPDQGLPARRSRHAPNPPLPRRLTS